MRRLDRYLVGSIVKVFVFSSFAALFLLLSLQALRLSELIIRVGGEGGTAVKMLAGLSVSFTPIILPIAFLFSLLMVFGRMSTDRELVAMQAMGHSPWRLLKPALGLGVFCSLLIWACCFFLAPYGNRLFEESIDEAFRKKVASVLRAGTFTEGFLDMVLFVDEVDSATGELRRVFLFDQSQFRSEVSVSARKGQWIQAGRDGWAQLKLSDGIAVSKDESTESLRVVTFKEYRINADFSQVAGRSRDSPPSLNAGQLWERRRSDMANPDKDPREIWVEMARRFAIGFVCFLFVPLAFALSLDNSRTARNRTVFLGLMVLGVYWSVYFLTVTWLLRTESFVRTSELAVWFFVWVPNLMTAVVAWILARRMLILRGR